MSENNPQLSHNQIDFEGLSATDESSSIFGIGHLDSEHAVTLKDWSAQDFANIYVRFRSHLTSHARRFLSDEFQVEEVVQDAFLYLMTALPELDSELGVLRFLKWKTKMLCLDVIRSSERHRAHVSLPDEIAHGVEPHVSLERADDAAIIMMALSKLSQRHREVLVSTLIEERTHEEVAKDLGVDRNALRQLLFRARASFREALVGESDVKGKTVSEILSLAARKASKSPTTVVLVLGTLAIVGLPQTLGGSSPSLELGQGNGFTEVLGEQTEEKRMVDPSSETTLEFQVDTESGSQRLSQRENLDAIETVSLIPGPSDPVQEAPPSNQAKNPIPVETELISAREKFNSGLDEQLTSALGTRAFEVTSNDQKNLRATNESGWTVFFALDPSTENVVQYVLLEYQAEGHSWKAVPLNSLSVKESIDGQTRVGFAATDFLIGDFSGSYDFVSTSESGFSQSGIRLDLVINDLGEVTNPSIVFLPST